MSLRDEFIKAYTSTVEKKSKAASSNEALEPIHSFIAKSITENLEKDKLIVHSLGFNYGHKEKNKEKIIEGRYSEKREDIFINYNNKKIAINIKVPYTNVTQNINNYFENFVGQFINMHNIKIGVGHVYILPYEAPYLKKMERLVKKESFFILLKSGSLCYVRF